MKCPECQTDIEILDEHLLACCGLTLQEYALRHGVMLDTLVPAHKADQEENPEDYPHASDPNHHDGRIVLGAARTAGRLDEDEVWQVIPGEIRSLDALLWMQQHLQPLGFVFRQEYSIAGGSHRMVARNVLKRSNQEAITPVEFAELSDEDRDRYVAVVVTCCASPQAGYIFFQAPASQEFDALCQWLLDKHGVNLQKLEPLDDRVWLRTRSLEDTQRLCQALQTSLREIPGQDDRFCGDGPRATVVKERGFDAAHFITDHPGSCANLHGGHYAAHFKIHDRIDPAHGFVMDYGILKHIIDARVIRALDHHTLNYAAPELAWRSSTEFLAAWIWERLIDYLPALEELEIHETSTSYCQYKGPSLEEFQAQGPSALLRHFQKPELGRSEVRQKLSS